MSRDRPLILAVDDEPGTLALLRKLLTHQGYDVVEAVDGRSALLAVAEHEPDLVCLDVMMPVQDGIQVCQELRRWDAFVPIVMLTARSQESDKIRGLDAGADDYVTKPFSVGELAARMRAILRRASRPTAAAGPEVLKIGDSELNLTAHTLTRDGRAGQLSFYEVELLRLLHSRAGVPVGRDEILAKVWGIDGNPTNRTVDNFVVKLRKKIEPSPDKPVHILTPSATVRRIVADIDGRVRQLLAELAPDHDLPPSVLEQIPE